MKFQDIWKDGEYLKWLLSSLVQTSFQELVFKAVNNRKRSGYVDCRRGQIDWPQSAFLQTQATHFETVMTTVDEVSDKTKVPGEFILGSVSLDCLLPNSISKLIHNRCRLTCKASF